jgi:hypothetical protein
MTKPSPKPGSNGPQKLDRSTPTRGASMQGERQDAKGGPAGANQGGAPRGGSRIEPSHQKQAVKKDRPKKSR